MVLNIIVAVLIIIYSYLKYITHKKYGVKVLNSYYMTTQTRFKTLYIVFLATGLLGALLIIIIFPKADFRYFFALMIVIQSIDMLLFIIYKKSLLEGRQCS